MTNLQDGVPILGDLPLLHNTYYSIELLVNHFVPEWNVSVSFPLEEDVVWDSEGMGWKWAFARQERFHLVKSALSAPLASRGDGGSRSEDGLRGDL